MLPEDENDETADFPGEEAIEQAFIAAAAGKLPLEQAEVSENQYGVRIYRWPSPCEAVGALTASIHEGEITLGTATFHDHIGAHAYEVRTQSPARDELATCIASVTVQLADEIMRGERIFSVSYDETGRATSSGMSPRDVWEQRLGEERWKPASQRFWDWHGEVFRD
ncbi:MAG: hypothetical protein B7Y36_05100 [Novosphingobium sp. 28-62-57]|uniref:hypothetical protein n=1 Tax=unclassified Novosphingobium TaxID=2644732 RepID=UPI000BDAA662|nr:MULTISPECIES: hypothetical protein [unclassified Novosphingobium]OYW50362.1 MAG: hypothetical protein B7Z34_05815 [Novosphingobium sp. 12-62-10]OYZ11534.1 MAG: hypothetical protein B7Y36_05100 [Novosphingobium sp. 28-62-57]OZA38703.1 MAG: hypothetical protein B7X92_03460 [Novosphingobium sp. 17-62-9]HQS68871.1 hypothetical protein [Novosphingobium sp.]